MKTYKGEEFNRESMYETAREYLLDGKKVKINGKKCKALIEVMLEDFRLEVAKRTKLLQRAEELKEKEDIGFLYELAQESSVSKTADYLQKRLENAIQKCKLIVEENEKMIIRARELKRLDKCSLNELRDFLAELYAHKQRIITLRLNGDCVNIITQKLLKSALKTIEEVKAEIKIKQTGLEK